MAAGSRHPRSEPVPPDSAPAADPPPPATGDGSRREESPVEARTPTALESSRASAEPDLPPGPPPDAAEFTRVFSAEAPRVWRALRRLGVPERDLEDVCQEVFLVLHRRWSEFRGASSLRTWIYGIALRKAIAHRRLKHVRDAVSLAPSHGPNVPPSQPSDLSRARTRDVLLRALDRLREGKREVFVLYELEELPMRDVAELVQAPLHTCYARLYAARSELAVALRRAGYGGERE